MHDEYFTFENPPNPEQVLELFEKAMEDQEGQPLDFPESERQVVIKLLEDFGALPHLTQEDAEAMLAGSKCGCAFFGVFWADLDHALQVLENSAEI